MTIIHLVRFPWRNFEKICETKRNTLIYWCLHLGLNLSGKAGATRSNEGGCWRAEWNIFKIRSEEGESFEETNMVIHSGIRNTATWSNTFLCTRGKPTCQDIARMLLWPMVGIWHRGLCVSINDSPASNIIRRKSIRACREKERDLDTKVRVGRWRKTANQR